MEHTELPWESTGSVVKRATGTFVPVADTYVSVEGYSPSIATREANAEFIVRACNAFADIEEGVSLIARKDHYYRLEAQAKCQPDLLTVCRDIEKRINLHNSVSTSDDILCRQLAAAINKANKET